MIGRDTKSHQRLYNLAIGTTWVFLAEALLIPTGFILTVFLTRQLGPANYGLFTLAAALVAWAETGISSAFDRTTVKFVGQSEDWRPVGTTLARLYLVTSVCMALLFGLLAGPIAAVLNEPSLALYLRLFALDIPLYSMARAHRSILVGTGRFRERAATSVGRWMTRLALIALLVKLGFSVPGAILGSIGASLVEWAIARLYTRVSFWDRSDFAVQQLWGYVFPLFLAAFGLYLYKKMDLFALKMLGGTAAQVGIYGAALTLGRLPNLLAKSFSPLLLSTLSRMWSAGEEGSARQMVRGAMRVVLCLLPVAGLVAGAASELTGLALGPLYTSGAPLMAWLVFGTVAQVVISISRAMLTAAGKPRWNLALTALLMPLAVVGHLLLIPRLGAVGAAVVSTLTAGLGALAAIWAIYRVWRILPPVKTLVRSCVVCVLAYGAATVWPVSGPMLFLKLLIIGLCILLAFLLLGELDSDDLALARRMLRKWMAQRRDVAGVL